MNSAVARDLGWSSSLFLEQVWPICERYVAGGELLQMEGRSDSDLAYKFDTMAGIDGWQICGDQMRGIASRIQKDGNDWATFTVRASRESGAKTEYEKRREAIHSSRGFLYPHLTIQAYSDGERGPIISVGIAETAEIIRYIEDGRASKRETKRDGAATFYFCPWDNMNANGYKVRVIRPLRSCK